MALTLESVVRGSANTWQAAKKLSTWLEDRWRDLRLGGWGPPRQNFAVKAQDGLIVLECISAFAQTWPMLTQLHLQRVTINGNEIVIHVVKKEKKEK